MSAFSLFNLHGGCYAEKGSKEQPMPVGCNQFSASTGGWSAKQTWKPQQRLPTHRAVPRASGPFLQAPLGPYCLAWRRYPQPRSQQEYHSIPLPNKRVPHAPKKGRYEPSLLPHSSLHFLSDPPDTGFFPLLPFTLGAPFLLINSPTRPRKCAPCDSSAQRIYEPGSQGKEPGHKSQNI